MEALREKIAKAMQADFIGDIVFSQDEIDAMKKKLPGILQKGTKFMGQIL